MNQEFVCCQTQNHIHYPKNCTCGLITDYWQFWGSGGHLTHKNAHAMYSWFYRYKQHSAHTFLQLIEYTTPLEHFKGKRSLKVNMVESWKPLAETIDVCMDRLYRGDPEIAPSIPEKVLRKLVSLCVCDNTFIFNNKVYNQIDGVAMGSSLGPVLANIWMSHLEETYIFGNEFFP